MITVYRKQNNMLHCHVLSAGEPIPSDAVWIDMHAPTHEEEIAVEKQLDIQIPSREEVWKNQVLNRLYQEDDVSYMTAAIINKADSPYPQTSAITFILSPHYLLTMRYITPTSFQNVAARLQKAPQKFLTGAHILHGLLEEMVMRVAHNSEVVVDALDQLSHDIFSAGMMREDGSSARNSSQQMKGILKRLSTCADLNSKINESLHSLNRMTGFFKQVNPAGVSLEASIGLLITDEQALIKQTSFLADKVTFQLDAALGMINVEQNMIIKIFSVVAVFFLPPTLVSSIYGMNFQHMPELAWVEGYPIALGIMALCALVPYLYFRKKGWL